MRGLATSARLVFVIGEYVRIFFSTAESLNALIDPSIGKGQIDSPSPVK